MKNTITVTIMSNQMFSHDASIISICGLVSSHADDGPMAILDGFAGCGHRHLFSHKHSEQSGYGSWNNTNKC